MRLFQNEIKIVEESNNNKANNDKTKVFKWKRCYKREA